MARGDEITTKFKVDISDLKSGISEANQQIKLANAEFKAATAGMDDWSKSADGIKAKLNQLESVLSAQKSKLAAYTEELSRQQDAYDKNGKRAEELKAALENLANNGVSKTSDEYKKYQNALDACEAEQEKNKKSIDALKITVLDQQAAVNKTEAEIGKYSTALDDLEKNTGEADKETQDLSKAVKESGENAKDSAGGFSVMKAALADLVASGIKAAISGLKDLAKEAYASWESFDDGADTIIAATGATGDAADELIESYKNVSRNIVGDFGDIGTALGEVNTRFGSTGAELEGLTEKFLKFSDLNGTDVKGSIDTVQSALAAFGLSAEDAGSMLDVLNKAGQDTGVNVQTLTQQLVANAQALQEMGYNASDSALFIANLSKSGIDASTVMAGMKKALVSAAEEGVPLNEAMAALEESIRGAETSTEAINIASEMFGSKAGPAIAKAVQDGRLSFEQFGTTLQDFDGNIDTTYENMLDGPDKIALAMQNLKLTAAEVFDKFLQEHGPQIEELVNNFTENVLPVVSSALDGIVSVVDWFIQNLPTIVPILEGIGVAMGTYIAYTTALKVMQEGWMALEVVQKAAAAAQWLVNAAMSANPIGIIVAAIAGLIAAFIALWNNCDEFREFWINLWDNIKEIAEKVWKAIKEVFTKAWDGIKNAFSKTKDFFKEKFEGARDAVKNAWSSIVDWFKGIWDKIKNAFSKVDSWMGDKFGGAWEAIKLQWSAVIGYFKNVWESIKAIFAVVKDVLSGNFQGAWDKIKEIVGKWKDYFKGIWDGIKSIFKPVGDFFEETFNKAKDAVKGPINFIIRGLNKLIQGVNKIGFDVPDWVPVIGGQKWGFNIPEIPELAKGGVLRRGQFGFLEGSGAEAVVPLEKNKFWIHEVAADLLRQIQTANGGGSVTNIGGSKDYNFTQIINAPQAPSRIEF